MRSNKPVIGITISQVAADSHFRLPVKKEYDYLKREYYQAIIRSGGVPLLLANVEPASSIYHLLDSVDGLLLTGGGDLHPRYYHQKPDPRLGTITVPRDEFELQILKIALKKDMPVLGICRGHQVLNVALGGTLHQDTQSVPLKTIRHSDPRQTGRVFHKIMIAESCRLRKIIGSPAIEVNSSHHQVIDKLGKGLKGVASAPDGINEAIELSGHRFVIGVQWHPEAILGRVHSQKLFRAFVRSASSFSRKAKH